MPCLCLGRTVLLSLHLIMASVLHPMASACTAACSYECVAAQKGSISAEHGLGQQKSSAIGYSQPPEAIAIMQQLKRVFDPNMILCPGISFGA